MNTAAMQKAGESQLLHCRMELIFIYAPGMNTMLIR